MKKKLLILTALAFQSLVASAFEGKAEIDGINYYIITKGATAEVVFKSSGYKGDVVIPETIEYDGVTCTVSSIGDKAFYLETELNSVSIPKTVTKIGVMAFEDCSNMKEANIPSTVTSLGQRAFYRCESLETLKADDITAWCNMEIGQDANPLPYVKHFIVGDEEVTDLVIPETVSKIGSRAFHGYVGLKSVTFSTSVTSIGDYAFFGCTGLVSANLPNTITELGADAFYECTSLNSLTLSSGLTTIKEYTFFGCSSLTTLSIPDAVTEIKKDAFKNCTNIKLIYIGSGLEILGHNAFQNCSELTDVYCWAISSPKITGYYKDYSLPFYNSHIEYATLHVPEVSISNYQGNDVWKDFGTIVAIPDGGLRGDVNGDGVVNGTDIQAIINAIVEGEYDEKADVNEDGTVNGTDIQEVINIIVNAE